MADADPRVVVDEIDPATGATRRTVATFTRASGPMGERMRTHLAGRPTDPDDDGDTDAEGSFYARWHNRDDAALALRARYRVRVRVGPAAGRELGFADVDVVRNEREFLGVDRTDFVPLVNGRTLRIKFRIDRPAVDADGDGACPATHTTAPVSGWSDIFNAYFNPTTTTRPGVVRCANVGCHST